MQLKTEQKSQAA